MNPDDRTPDEQELLDNYTSKMGRSYQVWDNFVLQGTYMKWEDAYAMATLRWEALPNIRCCQAVLVTAEISSVQAQDELTLRFMTTTTVIVTRPCAQLP